MSLYIFAFVVSGIIFYFWITYNSLITSRERIREAISSIDIQLKRRSDLIPNLVQTVKGYAKHEREVFENVTKARSQLLGAKSPKEKAEANDLLSNTLKSLFAVAENYPQLKASANFLELQEELTDTENKIAYARQFYNSNVLDYNTKIKSFPLFLFAEGLGFIQEEFFQSPEEEKKPVKVAF